MCVVCVCVCGGGVMTHVLLAHCFPSAHLKLFVCPFFQSLVASVLYFLGNCLCQSGLSELALYRWMIGHFEGNVKCFWQ
jgi:hypothetical protein